MAVNHALVWHQAVVVGGTPVDLYENHTLDILAIQSGPYTKTVQLILQTQDVYESHPNKCIRL
jgi:hypothetical protein